jgi:flagellar export protein FliJ
MAARSFRFRAQAALDLRLREEERAQQDLARAQADRQAALVRVQAASDAARQAREQVDAASRTARSVNELQWYRFWIVRLDHERNAHAAAVAARVVAVRRAAEKLAEARQRRESLDRFKTKARVAYDAAEADAERKLIDELATRRFAAARDRLQGELV